MDRVKIRELSNQKWMMFVFGYVSPQRVSEYLLINEELYMEQMQNCGGIYNSEKQAMFWDKEADILKAKIWIDSVVVAAKLMRSK